VPNPVHTLHPSQLLLLAYMHQEKTSQHPKLECYLLSHLQIWVLAKKLVTAGQTGDLAIDNVSSHYIPCSRTACTVHRTQQLAQCTQYNHLHLDPLLPLHMANFDTSK